MSTVLTWTDFFLGMDGLNLFNELHSFVYMELNIALFAFLCLSFWMDGSFDIQLVCMYTNYLSTSYLCCCLIKHACRGNITKILYKSTFGGFV